MKDIIEGILYLITFVAIVLIVIASVMGVPVGFLTYRSKNKKY